MHHMQFGMDHVPAWQSYALHHEHARNLCQIAAGNLVQRLMHLSWSDRYGYERELMTLLNQLCRDMNRKIERQKERAIIESSARPLNAEDKARLEAIKVHSGICHGHIWHTSLDCLECSGHRVNACGLDGRCIQASC